MSKLICLLGVIGSGKSYRANQFVDDAKKFDHSMNHINMADELREMLWDLFGWYPKNDEEYELFKKLNIGDAMISIENGVTKEVFRILKTGRELLQRMGTQVIRNRYPNFWAECWKKKVQPLLNEGKNVVCSDLRFPNELEFALKMETNNNSQYLVEKEFIFCDYKSDRYDATDRHESERMAQRILKDGYNDGDTIEFDYLWFLVNNADYMKTEISNNAKEFIKQNSKPFYGEKE